MEDLELALKVLSDILAERGFLEPGSLPARVAKLKQDLEAEETAREAAAAQEKVAQRRAVDEALIACVACGASVTRRESFSSSRGALCPACHHDRE